MDKADRCEQLDAWFDDMDRTDPIIILGVQFDRKTIVSTLDEILYNEAKYNVEEA